MNCDAINMNKDRDWGKGKERNLQTSLTLECLYRILEWDLFLQSTQQESQSKTHSGTHLQQQPYLLR